MSTPIPRERHISSLRCWSVLRWRGLASPPTPRSVDLVGKGKSPTSECYPNSHRHHYPEEPGEHHRQQVAHQREDEQRHIGDDGEAGNVDRAPPRVSLGVWGTPPSSPRSENRSSRKQLSCSSSPALDLQPLAESIHRSWNQRWGLGEAAAARAVHSAIRPRDPGFHIIEPRWNPGRFTYAGTAIGGRPNSGDFLGVSPDACWRARSQGGVSAIGTIPTRGLSCRLSV